MKTEIPSQTSPEKFKDATIHVKHLNDKLDKHHGICSENDCKFIASKLT